MTRLRGAVGLSVLVLAGCTTTPVLDGQSKPVPPERLLTSQYPAEGKSTLVIARDKGWLGGGCYLSVLIDGKVIARMDTGESLQVSVEPGRHLLGVSGDPEGKGLCGAQIGQPLKETATEIRVGETQRFRVLVDMNAGIDLRPTSM